MKHLNASPNENCLNGELKSPPITIRLLLASYGSIIPTSSLDYLFLTTIASTKSENPVPDSK